MHHLPRCLLVAACLAGPLDARADSELGPPPRLVESHVVLERMPGGYKIILTRKASEKLICALAVIGDGTPWTDIAKCAVKDLNDPDAEKKMEFLAFIIKTQAPGLKKSLTEKMGPGGAVIKVLGVENKLIPEPPPLAKALGEAFLPPKVNEQIQAGMKIINTKPLYWTVETRK